MLSNGDRSKKVLVIGIGNPLRSDDGVGPYVADCIEAKSLDGVSVWITQQLNVEDIERMIEFRKIVIVDASVSGLPLDFRPVKRIRGQMIASSHHFSPETFVDLAHSIYHKDLNIHLCTIRGKSFEVGEKISSGVLKIAEDAVELISSSIKE